MVPTTTQTRRTASRSRRVVTWEPERRVAFLIDNLGGVTAVANALGVNKSQPSRWRTGEEAPSAEVAGKLVDFEYVLTRALLLWTPEVARAWLTSPNAYLGGAKPVDALMLHGSGEVIAALDGAMADTFA